VTNKYIIPQLSGERKGKIMSDKEKMQEIYDRALEDWPMATGAIKGSYDKMHQELDNYMDAIERAAFCYGYEYAIREMGGRRNDRA